MARTAKDGLSKHPTKGFRLTIGKKADGKPRLFWLGQNRATGEYHADALRGQFDHMKADGRDVWTSADEARVRWQVDQFKLSMRLLRDRHHSDTRQLDEQRVALNQKGQRLGALVGEGNATPPQPAANATPEKATLYGAIKAYVASIKGKRMSDKHKERAKQVVETNLKRVRKDCPLAEVDFAWLDSLCDHFKNRPANFTNGKQLAPAGVKNILTYLRLFFQWLDDSSWGSWEAPRKLLKPFKIRIDDLMTPVELRAAGNIKQFEVGTLKTLYHAATDHQRAIMLAALFTGATQQELAVLEQNEFNLDTATLHHFRNKTHVEGLYWLPPELVDYLRINFAKRPTDVLAFRTAEGKALVTFKDGKQTSDAVRQAWKDLRETAEIPAALSFKFLRKFLADWMMRNGGEAMGQVALSHSRKTVLAKNYTSTRDFKEFNKLQREMHTELKAAGMFDPPEATKAQQKEPKVKKARKVKAA